MGWWRSRSKGPTCRREHRWARGGEGKASKTRQAWAESSARAAAKAASPFQSLYTSGNHLALRGGSAGPPVPSHLASAAPQHAQRASASGPLHLPSSAWNALPQISTQLISSLPSGLCSKVTLSGRPSLQKAPFSLAYPPLDSPRLCELCFSKVL